MFWAPRMRLLCEPSTWHSTAGPASMAPPEQFHVASPRSRPQAASRLRRELDRARERAAHGCRGALGIREGPTSTRIRITSRGPQVIELAARLDSPAEVELTRAATGVDLNALALKGALGEAIKLDELLQRPQAA